MMISSASGKQTKPFGGSRRVATAHAKAAIRRSDLQKQLEEKLGGFVWKVEMWPNWLQISVDALGNDETNSRLASKNAENWADDNKEQLHEMFSEVLGDKFGELAIMGKNMGSERTQGSCCRTGCGGCFNGPRNRLVDKLENTSVPLERYG